MSWRFGIRTETPIDTGKSDSTWIGSPHLTESLPPIAQGNTTGQRSWHSIKSSGRMTGALALVTGIAVDYSFTRKTSHPVPSATCSCEIVLPIWLRPDLSVEVGGYAVSGRARATCVDSQNQGHGVECRDPRYWLSTPVSTLAPGLPRLSFARAPLGRPSTQPKQRKDTGTDPTPGGPARGAALGQDIPVSARVVRPRYVYGLRSITRRGPVAVCALAVPRSSPTGPGWPR
jgi:hypothetical protein